MEGNRKGTMNWTLVKVLCLLFNAGMIRKKLANFISKKFPAPIPVLTTWPTLTDEEFHDDQSLSYQRVHLKFFSCVNFIFKSQNIKKKNILRVINPKI